MTLPFLNVFFEENCVNSHKTFFLWGEDLPVRGDDDDDDDDDLVFHF